MAANGDTGRGNGESRAPLGTEAGRITAGNPVDGIWATALRKSIDWDEMKANVRRCLRASRIYKARSYTRIRDGFSIDDVVQEAITEQLTAWKAGEPVPDDLADIEAKLIVRANRRWKAWMKRAREREGFKDLIEIDVTLSTRGMFEVICAQDECRKLFAALADSLDADAQMLLKKLLKDGIAFNDTKGLADPPSLTEAHVRNMKRRIITHGRRIMAGLIAAGKRGGAA